MRTALQQGVYQSVFLVVVRLCKQMFTHGLQYLVSVCSGPCDSLAIVADPPIVPRRTAIVHKLGMLHLASHGFIKFRQCFSGNELVRQLHVLNLQRRHIDISPLIPVVRDLVPEGCQRIGLVEGYFTLLAQFSQPGKYVLESILVHPNRSCAIRTAVIPRIRLFP